MCDQNVSFISDVLSTEGTHMSLTLAICILFIVVIASLAALERRLNYLSRRDDADPSMDSVNDRRILVCNHLSNAIGLLLVVAVVMIGIHTFSPHQ